MKQKVTHLEDVREGDKVTLVANSWNTVWDEANGRRHE